MRYTKFSSLLLSVVLLSGLCSISTEAQKKDGKIQLTPTAPSTPYSGVRRDSLLNGLQIIALDRLTDTSVKVDIIIRAGAKFDLVGKTGLARLTQETLLAVNPRLKEELESLQAKIDWGVTWDTTWFHIETAANNFDSVMEIFARLVVVENIRADAFKRAQAELLEKIKSDQQSPAERADESFLKALYGDHPYGHNLDGSESTVTGIKQGDIYDFMRRFYIANNVAAVVTGNITLERAMRAFKTFFGGWIKSQIVPSTFRPPKQIAQLNLVKVEASDITNVEIRGGVVGVKHSDPEFLTTEVLAKILAARLKKDAEGSAREFTVKASPRVLPGPFFFSAIVPAEQAPAFSRRATESFAALSTTPVSSDELAAAKSALASEYSARPVEYNLREIEVYSLPRDYPLRIAGKIDAITVVDVQRVAKKLLDANALTLVVLGKVNESFKSNL
ncbi:MAG: insulinase family protein [Acidobacteria bacterium]|nr:insulinase family protein [Acidobacteriota bacterium]